MTNFRSFPTGYARRLQACKERIRYLKFAGFASSDGVLGPSLRQKSAANQLIYRFRRTAPVNPVFSVMFVSVSGMLARCKV